MSAVKKIKEWNLNGETLFIDNNADYLKELELSSIFVRVVNRPSENKELKFAFIEIPDDEDNLLLTIQGEKIVRKLSWEDLGDILYTSIKEETDIDYNAVIKRHKQEMVEVFKQSRLAHGELYDTYNNEANGRVSSNSTDFIIVNKISISGAGGSTVLVLDDCVTKADIRNVVLPHVITVNTPDFSIQVTASSLSDATVKSNGLSRVSYMLDGLAINPGVVGFESTNLYDKDNNLNEDVLLELHRQLKQENNKEVSDFLDDLFD